MTTPSLKSLLLAAALLPLAGCALTPDHQRPELDLPAAWDGDVQAGTTVTADWWQRFGSDELNRLMADALAANYDLAAAMSRIEQARATARIARAGQLPSAELSGSISHSSRDDGTRTTRGENDEVGLSVGYELDLWGGNAASAAAARARLDASVYDRDALALVLQAEVAANYFQALALKDRLAIAERNLEAARQVLALVQVRYDEGAATGLELAQQRTAVHNIEAQLPQLRQQLRLTENALAVLLGRPPQGFSIEGTGLAGLTLPTVAPGQPAELLDRRPDIRRAEAQLIAANADIGAARAALYPTVRLSASAGLSGLVTGGSGSVASIAASLAQTIFDGGRLRAQVEQSEARRTELAAQYAQAVLVSLREVQDSLISVDASTARAEALRQTVAQARDAFEIASARYEAGAEDLLNLLDAQRTLLQTEDSLLQAELARYSATTDLFKALGGGWAVTDSDADR